MPLVSQWNLSWHLCFHKKEQRREIIKFLCTFYYWYSIVCRQKMKVFFSSVNTSLCAIMYTIALCNVLMPKLFGLYTFWGSVCMHLHATNDKTLLQMLYHCTLCLPRIPSVCPQFFLRPYSSDGLLVPYWQAWQILHKLFAFWKRWIICLRFSFVVSVCSFAFKKVS